MFLLALSAVLIVGLIGLGVKKILEIKNSDSRITWREFGIGMMISPVVTGLVVWGGWAMARNGQLTFTEYWNGWETAAVKENTQCTKNGSCRWNYDCEPYIVMVAYECNCSTDDKGHTSCSTCYRPETRYHSCPYVSREYHFYVDSTLGRYDIATNVFPDNPESNRWTNTYDYRRSIPAGVVSRAGTGEPPFWVAVRNRIYLNQPGPVTARRDYLNFILASEHTLMKEFSGDISDYKNRKVLPELTRNVQNLYHANKVYFVGTSPHDPNKWQDALEYLNAELGVQLQGDLHLVIIKNDFVSSNPDRYTLALKAYWQDKETFGKDALSKNAIVVLVGTADGSSVSWSRAFTGMPLGNERLIVVMRDGLKGSPLTYESLIGPVSSRRDAKGTFYPSENNRVGKIQRIVSGWDDSGTKFKRIEMSGKDGQGGFLYLKNEIQPSTGQSLVILIITILICSGAWVWAAKNYDQSEVRTRWGR